MTDSCHSPCGAILQPQGRDKRAFFLDIVKYNAAMKECPLCGETMRLSVREVRYTVPGGGQATRVTREWICPECDYFEEAEAGEG
jgi:hypothetical protein